MPRAQPLLFGFGSTVLAWSNMSCTRHVPAAPAHGQERPLQCTSLKGIQQDRLSHGNICTSAKRGLERTQATRVRNIKQSISYRDQEGFSAQGCTEREAFPFNARRLWLTGQMPKPSALTSLGPSLTKSPEKKCPKLSGNPLGTD